MNFIFLFPLIVAIILILFSLLVIRAYIKTHLIILLILIIKGLELISIYRKDIDVLRYENIVEPFDFHIKTNIKDDLIIDSVEDTKALLDDLRNVKVDKELSKYFTKCLNE